MRSRIFAVLAIAILAGGGLAYGTYNIINAQPVKAAPAPTQAVVVAAADLPLGAALKADDLKTVNFPKGQAPEGAYEKVSDVVGPAVISPRGRNEVGIPATLMGLVKAPAPVRQPSTKSNVPVPVTTTPPATALVPTVEVIRGDKRTAEVIK